MDKLDRLVSEKMAEKLLTPERVRRLLSGLMNRQSARDEDHSG
jgi:site-specific DNA recombinase